MLLFFWIKLYPFHVHTYNWNFLHCLFLFFKYTLHNWPFDQFMYTLCKLWTWPKCQMWHMIKRHTLAEGERICSRCTFSCSLFRTCVFGSLLSFSSSPSPSLTPMTRPLVLHLCCWSNSVTHLSCKLPHEKESTRSSIQSCKHRYLLSIDICPSQAYTLALMELKESHSQRQK